MINTDFIEKTEGDTFLLTPQTLRAKSWAARRIATLPTIGRAYVIASTPEFARIVNAAIAAGFIVEERRRIDANLRFGKDRVREPSPNIEPDDDDSSDDWDCEVLLDKYKNSDF